MEQGALTGYVDVAQVVLYAFWVFFAGLVFYLRREDKREGYPLDSDRTDSSGGQIDVVGFPSPPSPKTFTKPDGTIRQAPRPEEFSRPEGAEPAFPWPGSPLQPVGDPMNAGVGPGSWADRPDEPDPLLHGDPKIVPLRVATDYSVAEEDPDPRGMPVIAADYHTAGTVHEVWVDRSEMRVLYLEVALAAGGGEGTTPETVLLPINFARVKGGDEACVRVVSITAEQFAGVPRLRNPDQVTLLEEDRITAYFGGGHLYAHPAREEPLL